MTTATTSVAEASAGLPDAPAAPASVSFAEAFRFWLKLGFISFGGPAGQIAIMHTELVERRRWISEQRFLHALNYCMLLPGPEAQQLATYIGWLMHRTWGGIVAGALFVLPSLFILIALSWIYLRFGHVPLVAGIFYGLKPAVTALVLHAAHRIGTRALKNRWMWGIAAASFVAIFAFDTPFPAIVLAAGADRPLRRDAAGRRCLRWAAGMAAAKARLRACADRRQHADAAARALFSRAGLAQGGWASGSGCGCWRSMARWWLVATAWQGTLTQMGWFFTKAALAHLWRRLRRAALRLPGRGRARTSGSAGTQMIDGLALGRDDTRPADHGGGLRRFRRRLAEAGVRA